MRAYLQERVLTGKTLAAVTLLSAVSAAAVPTIKPAGIAIIAILVFLLFVQFRLWDDLSDLSVDRIRHPRRVLCRASSLTPFRVTQIALLIVNACLLALWRPHAMFAYGLLNLSFLIWYGGTTEGVRRFVRSPLIRSHILLLKYPAFVFLLCGGHAVGGAIPPSVSMAFVYLCCCVFELVDDPQVRESRGASLVLFAELAGLLALSGMIVSELP